MNGKFKKMFGKKVAKVLSIFLSCAIAVSSFAPVAYATDGVETTSESHVVTHQIFMGSGNMCDVPAVGTTADVARGQIFGVKFYDNGELIDVEKVSVSEEGLVAAGFEVTCVDGDDICNRIDLKATDTAELGSATLYFTIAFDDGTTAYPTVTVNVVEEESTSTEIDVNNLTLQITVDGKTYTHTEALETPIEIQSGSTYTVTALDQNGNVIADQDYFSGYTYGYSDNDENLGDGDIECIGWTDSTKAGYRFTIQQDKVSGVYPMTLQMGTLDTGFVDYSYNLKVTQPDGVWLGKYTSDHTLFDGNAFELAEDETLYFYVVSQGKRIAASDISVAQEQADSATITEEYSNTLLAHLTTFNYKQTPGQYDVFGYTITADGTTWDFAVRLPKGTITPVIKWGTGMDSLTDYDWAANQLEIVQVGAADTLYIEFSDNYGDLYPPTAYGITGVNGSDTSNIYYGLNSDGVLEVKFYDGAAGEFFMDFTNDLGEFRFYFEIVEGGTSGGEGTSMFGWEWDFANDGQFVVPDEGTAEIGVYTNNFPTDYTLDVKLGWVDEENDGVFVAYDEQEGISLADDGDGTYTVTFDGAAIKEAYPSDYEKGYFHVAIVVENTAENFRSTDGFDGYWESTFQGGEGTRMFGWEWDFENDGQFTVPDEGTAEIGVFTNNFPTDYTLDVKLGWVDEENDGVFVAYDEQEGISLADDGDGTYTVTFDGAAIKEAYPSDYEKGYFHVAIVVENSDGSDRSTDGMDCLWESTSQGGDDNYVAPEDTFTGKVLIAPQVNSDGTIADSETPWWNYKEMGDMSGNCFKTVSDQSFAVEFTDEKGNVISSENVEITFGDGDFTELEGVSDDYKVFSFADGYTVGEKLLTFKINDQYKTIRVISEYAVAINQGDDEIYTDIILDNFNGSFDREFTEEYGTVNIHLIGENILTSSNGEPVIKTAGNLVFWPQEDGSLTVNFGSKDGKTTAIEAGGGLQVVGEYGAYTFVTVNDMGQTSLVDGENVTNYYGADVVVGEGGTYLFCTDLTIDGDFIVNNKVEEDWSEEVQCEYTSITAENIVVNGGLNVVLSSKASAKTVVAVGTVNVSVNSEINLNGEAEDTVGISANDINVVNGALKVNGGIPMYHENLGFMAAVYAANELYMEFMDGFVDDYTNPSISVTTDVEQAYAVAARNFSMRGGSLNINSTGEYTTALYTYGNAEGYDYGTVVHSGNVTIVSNGYGIYSNKDIQLGNPDVGAAYADITANKGYALYVNEEIGGRVILENTGIKLYGSEGAVSARYIPVDTENGEYDFGYNEDIWLKAGTSAEDAKAVFDYEDIIDCTYLETVEPDEDAKAWVYFDTNFANTGIENVGKVIGNRYGSLPVPVKLGYRFIGWTTDEAGTDFVDSNTRVKETYTTLYAQWEEGDANTLYFDGINTDDYIRYEEDWFFISSRWSGTLNIEFTGHNIIDLPFDTFICETLNLYGEEGAVLKITSCDSYGTAIFASNKITFNGKAEYIINGRVISEGNIVSNSGIEFNGCSVEMYSASADPALMSYGMYNRQSGDIVVNNGAIVSVYSENGTAVLTEGGSVVVNKGGALGTQGKTYGVQSAVSQVTGVGGKITVVKGGSLVAVGNKAAMNAETYSLSTAKKMVAGFNENTAQTVKKYNNERFFSIGDYAEVGAEVFGDMIVNGYWFSSEEEFEGYGFRYVPNTTFGGKEGQNVLYLEDNFVFDTVMDVEGIETFIFSPTDLIITSAGDEILDASVECDEWNKYLVYSLGDLTVTGVSIENPGHNVHAENLSVVVNAELDTYNLDVNGDVTTELANLTVYGVMDVKGSLTAHASGDEGYDILNITPENSWTESKIYGDLILYGGIFNTANDLRVYGDVVLNGAYINAKSDVEDYQAHITVDGDFAAKSFSGADVEHLTAGDVTVNGMAYIVADRLTAENVTVYEYGTLNTTNTDGYASLTVTSKLTVDGGSVYVWGGIDTYELINKNGTIKVYDCSNGIDLSKMTMTGGNIEIDAACHGIILRSSGKTSAINITGGEVDIEAGEYAIYLVKGTKATINTSKNKTAAKLRLYGARAAVYTAGTLTAYGNLTEGWYYDGLESTAKYTGLPLLYVNVKTHYNVTYHFDNGDPDYVEKVRVEATAPELYAEKQGFTFDGWYTSDGEKWDFTTPVTENTDLYAHWVSHKYTLHANGGKFVTEDNGTDTFVVNVPYNGYFEDQTIPTPSKANCIFAGWYVNAECTGEYTYGTAATGDVELYAYWLYKNTVADVTATIVPADADRETTDVVYGGANSNTGVKLGDRIVLSTSTPGATIRYLVLNTDEAGIPDFDDYKVYTGPIEITKAMLTENGDGEGEENYDRLGLFVYAQKEEYNNSADNMAIIIVDAERNVWGDVLEEDRAGFTDALDVPDYMWIANAPTAVEYTGAAIKADEMRVYDNKTLLTLNKDYTVAYKNNTNAGTATITVKGKGAYADTLTETFTITPMEIDGSAESGAVFETQLNATVKTYNKKVQKPTVKFLKDGKALKANTDYTVSYEMYDETTESWSVAAAGPKEVGRYRVVITGKGNYSGVAYAEYTITSNVLASVFSVSGIKAANYTGEAIEQPAMVVKYGKTVLVEGEHYTVDYKDNIEVGTATVVITAVEGSGYEGTKEVTFKINGTKLTASMIKGFAANVAYNGGEHTQSGMYLVNKNVTLTEDVDYTVSYEANTVSGTAKVTVTGMGGYTGSVTKTFTIGTKLAASMLKNFKTSVKYFDTVNDAGYVEQPEDELKVTVKVDGVSTVVTLTEGVDYTATYTNNDKAGTATVVYEGMGAYYGTFKKTFKIAATAFSAKLMEVKYWTDALTYTGSNIEQPNYDLYYNGTWLIEGEDYTVTYSNNLKAGKATVTFKGITGYSGSYSKTFVINKVNAENADVVDIYMPEEVVYTKGAAIAEPVITYGDITLVKGTDYTVAYKNHTKQGTATATITFKGNYTGKVTKTYTITASSLENVTVTAADKVFSNKVNAYKVTPKLVDTNNKALSAGTDYDKVFVYTYEEDVQLANGIVRYAGDTVGAKDVVPAGATIRVTVMGKGNYAGETSVTYRVTQSTVASASVAIEAQNYTGKAVELDKNQITVKVGKTELNNTDYEIIGYSNNTKIGTAKVTIKGVGNYGGTKTVTFKIQAKSAKTVIKFMPNGGSGSVASMNVMNNDVQLNSIINIKGKQTLTRKGYEFAGWNTEKDGTGDWYADADTFFASDRGNARTIRLYAQWNRVEYTITYVGVEDAVNENPETYNVDTATFKLANPSKEGYKFEGWYTNSNLKSGKTVQIAKGSTGDKVFYAKWKAL